MRHVKSALRLPRLYYDCKDDKLEKIDEVEQMKNDTNGISQTHNKMESMKIWKPR
jgi:hypothetical protein